MNESLLNRWNPGIAIRRWKMPLMAVLLIAIATGVSLEGLAYLRAQEAKCVIQYRNTPSLSLEEMRELIVSDALLEEARHRAASPLSQSEVKKLVRCEPIKGTSLLIISAKGWNTPAKIELCNALADLAKAKAIANRDKAKPQELEKMRASVKSLEARAEAKCRQLSELQRYQHLLHFFREPIQGESRQNREFHNAIKELEADVEELNMTRFALFHQEEWGGGLVVGPFAIHEPAGPPRPIAFAEILPCALRLSTWIGSGFIAALILAFLLEAMRRTPQKPVIYE